MTDTLSSPTQYSRSARCLKLWKPICWAKLILALGDMLHMKLIIVYFTANTHASRQVHTQIHENTQTHIHSDFLCRVSVYVSVLGLQGFGMSSAWDTQGQGCHRIWGGCGAWAFSFSHRPRDTYRTYNTHTFIQNERCTLSVYFSLTIEDVNKMQQRWWKHTMPFPQTHSFRNTTHSHIQSFLTSLLPYAEVNELVLNSFTSRQELHSKALKIAAKTKRGSDVRALPIDSPLNLSQSCRPLGPTLTNA